MNDIVHGHALNPMNVNGLGNGVNMQFVTTNVVIPHLLQHCPQPVPVQAPPPQAPPPQQIPQQQYYAVPPQAQPVPQAQPQQLPPQQTQSAIQQAFGQVAGYLAPQAVAQPQMQPMMQQYQIPQQQQAQHMPPPQPASPPQPMDFHPSSSQMSAAPSVTSVTLSQQSSGLSYTHHPSAPLVHQSSSGSLMASQAPPAPAPEASNAGEVNVQRAGSQKLKDASSDEEACKEVKFAPPTEERPCDHNEWDDVRTRRRAKILQCRVCLAKWKLNTSIPRCSYFLHSKCDKGQQCRMLHVYKKRVDRAEREQLYEQVKADMLSKAKAAAAADSADKPPEAATSPTAQSDKEPSPAPVKPPGSVASDSLPPAPRQRPPVVNVVPTQNPMPVVQQRPSWGATPTATSPSMSECMPTLISPSPYTPSCALTPGPVTSRSQAAAAELMPSVMESLNDVYGMCYRGAVPRGPQAVPKSMMSPEEAVAVEAEQKKVDEANGYNRNEESSRRHHALALARGHMKSFVRSPYSDEDYNFQDVLTPATPAFEDPTPTCREAENEGIDAMNEEDLDALLATPIETLRKRRMERAQNIDPAPKSAA